MIKSIAGVKCGAVRSRPGGPVQKVVAAGGHREIQSSTVEIYDMASNRWTSGKLKSDQNVFRTQVLVS